jgi:hypothetical protein
VPCVYITNTATSVFLDALRKPEVASQQEWRQTQTSVEAHKYSNEIKEVHKYSLPVDLASFHSDFLNTDFPFFLGNSCTYSGVFIVFRPCNYLSFNDTFNSSDYTASNDKTGKYHNTGKYHVGNGEEVAFNCG